GRVPPSNAARPSPAPPRRWTAHRTLPAPVRCAAVRSVRPRRPPPPGRGTPPPPRRPAGAVRWRRRRPGSCPAARSRTGWSGRSRGTSSGRARGARWPPAPGRPRIRAPRPRQEPGAGRTGRPRGRHPGTGRSPPAGTAQVREPGPLPCWPLARRARNRARGPARSLGAGGGGALLLTGRLGAERDRRHAEPVTGGGLRRIVEDVAQMRTTVAAQHLGAHHAHAAVLVQFHGVVLGGLVETRPAAMCLELGGRAEKFGTTGPAVVHTHAVF